ncbi:MAG: sterol carrier family protein [Geodermatophilaceae bacterium]
MPPAAAVQLIGGPRHTRGTPPGVVETDPATFLRLATGRMAWSAAVERGQLRASGERTDLSESPTAAELRHTSSDVTAGEGPG